MPDELYEELLARAVQPERPSAAVEEDVLLRLEAEIERHRAAGSASDDVARDDSLVSDPVAVVEFIEAPTEQRRPTSVVASAVLGLVAAVLVGFLLLSGSDEGAVEVDRVAETIDSTTVPLPAVSTPIELVDAACGEVLPGLKPGTQEVLSTFVSDEVAIEIEERLADLGAITEALSGAVADLGAEHQQIKDDWQSHLIEMRNAELLFDQEQLNGFRHSLPTMTGDTQRLLQDLVAGGANQCSLWAKGN